LVRNPTVTPVFQFWIVTRVPLSPRLTQLHFYFLTSFEAAFCVKIIPSGVIEKSMSKNQPVKKEMIAEIVYEPVEAQSLALVVALEIVATAANFLRSTRPDADLPVIA
jgi:hypothetical protein